MIPTALGFELLPGGAAWWPGQQLLVVADLHLEKGSSRAARGIWLPPYDTAHTLERLRRLIEERAPSHIVCLGDAFEDPGAWHRMDEDQRNILISLTHRCPWTWIAGNHDPRSPSSALGPFLPQWTLGGITFSHEPAPVAGPRVFAHFHPKAEVRLRGRRIAGPCFLATDLDLCLPAFGSFTGGLDRSDPAWHNALRGMPSTWLVHKSSVYRVA